MMSLIGGRIRRNLSDTGSGIRKGRWSGQMFKAAITLAALVTAVSLASSPTFAQSGREAGGAAKTTAVTPVNKPVATPKTDKSSSNLYKLTATGKHIQRSQIR